MRNSVIQHLQFKTVSDPEVVTPKLQFDPEVAIQDGI